MDKEELLQSNLTEEAFENAIKRHYKALPSMDRMRHLAYRAKNVHNLTNKEVIIVCIEVDSIWRWLVDILMPNHDWEAIRMFEARPLAIGTASFAICKDIAKELPDIADIIMGIPEDNLFKCIILDDTGGTVYDIKPVEQKSN
jgi:hypothetical protein